MTERKFQHWQADCPHPDCYHKINGRFVFYPGMPGCDEGKALEGSVITMPCICKGCRVHAYSEDGVIKLELAKNQGMSQASQAMARANNQPHL